MWPHSSIYIWRFSNFHSICPQVFFYIFLFPFLIHSLRSPRSTMFSFSIWICWVISIISFSRSTSNKCISYSRTLFFSISCVKEEEEEACLFFCFHQWVFFFFVFYHSTNGTVTYVPRYLLLLTFVSLFVDSTQIWQFPLCHILLFSQIIGNIFNGFWIIDLFHE